ncbi:hypothetical protein [Kyrpidia tusciae]|uniref:hypothetical protein n=1 Tax=Kyrpidia tusciae TaxID=33943 RepID=UPI00031745AF|nr:hypothetical protein [Kyrpidia tusciae]
MGRIVDVQDRLPLGRALPLSAQHMFAMFGSTVMVPFLTGPGDRPGSEETGADLGASRENRGKVKGEEGALG